MSSGTTAASGWACEFRDNIFAFGNLGAGILGISVDDVASHKHFAQEHSLPFTLLADSTKETFGARQLSASIASSSPAKVSGYMRPSSSSRVISIDVLCRQRDCG
jgi:peroxiredoxin